MAFSFSQRAFDLTKHSGDRAAFLFQEPQPVPQTDYFRSVAASMAGPIAFCPD
jgi:hypothetical protein